jgi:hypothetical protein
VVDMMLQQGRTEPVFSILFSITMMQAYTSVPVVPQCRATSSTCVFRSQLNKYELHPCPTVYRTWTHSQKIDLYVSAR